MSIVLDAVRGNQVLKVNNPYCDPHSHDMGNTTFVS